MLSFGDHFRSDSVLVTPIGGAGRPPAAAQPDDRPTRAAAPVASERLSDSLFCISVSISGAGAFDVFLVAFDGLSLSGRFVCAPAPTNVVGQEAGRSLLGAVSSRRGCLCSAEKNRSIYHGTCAAHVHSSCGVVVEWKCMYRSAHVVR